MTRDIKHSMIPALFILALINGCSFEEPLNSKEKNTMGSDKNAQGCIPSAGYKWCARTEQCERPWEIAKHNDTENTSENFDFYCKK